MTPLQKQWENLDLREAKQVICQPKGVEKTYPKIYFLLNMRNCIKTFGYLSKVLAHITMTTYQI